MRSFYIKVPGVCTCLMWVIEYGKGESEDRSMGGHHLHRVVDVEKVRTLIWCRKYAGWSASNKLGNET